MPFLANCSPEVIETLHGLHNQVLCDRLSHYINTKNKEKTQKIVEFILAEDLRYHETKQHK